MNRLTGFFLLFFLIGGCAQAPEKLNQENSSRWLEHQLDINAIESWHIRGRVAIKNDNESGTLTLHWNQEKNNYELRFIAPFGQGTYILTGSADGVIMQGTDNNVLTATTPEQLMQDVLGWSVHLNGLKYWVRGIPEPDVNHGQILLDQEGRLANMNQAGFNVSITRYTNHNGISLPEKLSIRNDSIQLKLIIQNWNI